MKTPKPCAQWAKKLIVTHPEDLSSSDRIALIEHVASCRACADAYTDAILLGLPPVEPLHGLPPQLLQMWEEEDKYSIPYNFTAGANTEPIPLRALSQPNYRATIKSASKGKKLRRIVIVLIASAIFISLGLLCTGAIILTRADWSKHSTPTVVPSHSRQNIPPAPSVTSTITPSF